MKLWKKKEYRAAVFFALLLVLSLGVNVRLGVRARRLDTQLMAQRQREKADVVGAMADIEVNLQKLLLASGAAQSAQLLGETALLAQHVENGVTRLPLSAGASHGAMKFAGLMGDYAMTLAVQVSSGGMLTAQDEARIESLLGACQGLNAHLLSICTFSTADLSADQNCFCHFSLLIIF